MEEDIGRCPSGRAATPSDPSQSGVVSGKAGIPNAEKVLLTGMGPSPNGGFEMGFADGPESGGVLGIIAGSLAQMLRLDSDKPLNCIQMDVQPKGQPLLRLTMERAGGKSPLTVKNEAVRLLKYALEAIETQRSERLFIARDAIRNFLAEDPASAIEAAAAGETTKIGSTEGESAVGASRIAQKDHPHE